MDSPIGAAVTLADLEGDGLLEVVLATRTGDVWVLNGQTGQDHTSSHYPIHLESGVETPVLTLRYQTIFDWARRPLLFTKIGLAGPF